MSRQYVKAFLLRFSVYEHPTHLMCSPYVWCSCHDCLFARTLYHSWLSYLCIYKPPYVSDGDEGLIMILGSFHLAYLRDESMRSISVLTVSSFVCKPCIRLTLSVIYSLPALVCPRQSCGDYPESSTGAQAWSRSLCLVLLPLTSKHALHYSRSITYTNTLSLSLSTLLSQIQGLPGDE